MLLGIRYIATVISKLDPDAYINYANTINKPYVITPTSPQSMESRRIGVIGYKQGMTAIWNKWGVYTPCTVVQLDKPQVLSTRPHREKPGLFHAQVGGGYKKYFKLSKPEIGQFLKANVPPKKDIFQFTITKEGILPVGFMLTVRHFLPGQFVDVIGTSKGKGFQGTMKRWNFKGMPASHGNSVSHRRPGSIGMREFPGHVWKGKKMAGNMGNERITVQNLMVARIDERYSLLYLKGAVPGIIGSRVVLRDAIKMHMKQNKIVPFPTFIADPAKKYEAIENAPDPLLDSLELRRNDNTLIEGIDDEEMESLMDEDPDVKK